ncbi:MAG: beta-lactamase domain protein [Verrucomicrobia bacterium]|nr:beta-lactamase domain protein [Verrucomicrobiota bacterium]
MNVHVLPAGPIETNAYLLTAPERGEAILVDAPEGVWADVRPILAEEKCRLVELWLTHGHWDHTQGAAEIVRETKAKVRAHADDRILFETPEVMSLFLPPGVKVAPMFPDHWVAPGETFEALGLRVEVRHVPGHCPGNVLFYLAALKPPQAYVGDALFAGSVGRTDFPGGSMEVLANSIHRQIYTLPPDTIVYPGHGPATTVGTEQRSNPYVRA